MLWSLAQIGWAGYNDERYGGKAVIENNNDSSNIDTISA